MRIILGALLCWAGFHAEHHEMFFVGVRVRCKRCGCPLGWAA